MIKSLNIHNFQSHRKTELEFSSGVNILCGPSDCGKTAILRALRWLVWNRPVGDEFRSDWGGDTTVEITTTDHDHFQRVKSKGENLYRYNEQDLKAFGKDVPEEIRKALNIDDINLQKQFDSPFLISSSPGEVAAYFNKIAHLTKIDTSIAFVKSKITKLTSQKDADEETLKAAQENIKQYDYLDKFEIDLEILEHQLDNYIQLRASRIRLQQHLVSIEENETKILENEQTTKLEKPVDQILKMWEERGELIKEKGTLALTLLSIYKKGIAIEQTAKKIKLLPQVEALLKMYKERKKLQTNYNNLQDSLSSYQTIIQKQTKTQERIKKKEAKFHKHMPEVCPLCGK